MSNLMVRGKRSIDDQWTYGWYSCIDPYGLENGPTHNIVIRNNIIGEAYQVRPETIGQSANLKDKNSNEVFEGDLLTIDGTGKYLVYEYNGVLCVDYETPEYDFIALGFLKDNVTFEVIGNIHDNPELLEVR